MATIPSRVESFRKASGSLRGQVKLSVFMGDNALGDANKFRGAVGVDGYLFTVDDDLIYPPNYIEFMKSKVDEYKRKAVITLHGKVINRQPVLKFYRGDFIKYRCLDAVEEDVPVHIPGTGVMAWHSDTIRFEMSDFKEKNMADIWAGIKCEKQGVPRICAAHTKGYLTHIPNVANCYDVNRHRDKVLTDAINSISWT